ncbi:hypothetical protein FGL86_10715 [Pistricoccus aurantiacus]|uniref:Uncharacterized protein n=1 Tax=Pistricoccus aurantiacus TaxID=1883414 RepID=A0A5B8ST76_9GAMM|nr:hypothetical protein [Pistricoccus aurantiacus]QEA39501.1 hypothetical protein FGL86_10715 [Pistricoccus aurantiacus]
MNLEITINMLNNQLKARFLDGLETVSYYGGMIVDELAGLAFFLLLFYIYLIVAMVYIPLALLVFAMRRITKVLKRRTCR